MGNFGMKVTIEERSATPVFKRGNLVVHTSKGTKFIVLVDQDMINTSPSFAGTVLFCSDETYEVGFRTSGWTKASFEAFNGTITLEV